LNEINSSKGRKCTLGNLHIKNSEWRNCKVSLEILGETVKTTVGTIEGYTAEFFELSYDYKGLLNTRKYTKFFKIFAHYLYRYTQSTGIKLPPYNGKSIDSAKKLYEVLLESDKDRDVKNKLADIRWSDICPDSPDMNHAKLCLYLFDIEMEDFFITECTDRLHREWKGIPFDTPVSITEFSSKFAVPIIKAALVHPLFRYYFGAEVYQSSDKAITPLTHIYEVRELLKRCVSFDHLNNVHIIPPITGTVRYVKESAQLLSKEHEYTLHDFLFLTGWVAHKTAKHPNYLINSSIQELVSCIDAEICQDKSICQEVSETLMQQNFLIENGKFKVRSYRLVCAAYYASCCLNSVPIQDEDSVLTFKKKADEFLYPYLTRYLQDADGNDLVVLGEDFFKNADAAAFYSVSVIANLDFQHRELLLNSICMGEASDFSIPNRPKQELYIYILVNVLCTNDIEISSELRKKIFEVTFGKTLYSFQIAQWDYIKDTSVFYEKEIHRSMKRSMSLKECGDKEYSVGQPMYNFICGKTGEDAENNLWQKASALAFDAFGNRKGLDDVNAFLNEIPTLTTFEVTSQNIETALAYHMLAYSMSDVRMFNPNIAFEDFSKSFSDIFNNLIRADYIVRMSNEIYCQNNVDYKSLYLPCGVYRCVCQYELEIIEQQENKVNLEKEVAEQYYYWLNRELEDGNIRYAMLMSRMLMCTDFYKNGYNIGEAGILPTLEEIIYKNRNIIMNKENPILLPYDKFQRYL